MEALGRGEPGLADAELELKLAGRSVEARLIEAELALRRGARDRARDALYAAAALAPNDPRPRERYAALFHRDELPRDLPGLLAATHRFAAASPELADLAPALGRLREALDRPLVVTVMGEFNAGKSTFVNAFLGEEVAPMGITPTTATVNILKYGAERKGRVLYLDESTRELPWSEVPGFLKRLGADEARTIRIVELLYPLELLQRINVVDTPGLNSIHPEHEEVARRFIDEADAVIWLFSVDQAAKASEGEALSKIAAAGRKILGVLNKIDRASDEERAQIIAHVSASLGDRLETIVPVSARGALAARRARDDAALDASNYPTLDATLEERFFSRARLIQKTAALGRAKNLMADAARLVDERLAALTVDPHERALAAARADALLFARDFVPAERRRLLAATDEALQICVREVLDFVRPRRTFLGSNEATPADRDFLLSLLEERVTIALADSAERVRAQIEKARLPLAELPGAIDGPGFADLDERVYGRYRAFVRGYLRGGAVRDFFANELPKMDLTEGEVRRALERATPLDDDTLEGELRAPLRGFGEQFFAAMAAILSRRKIEVTVARFDLESRLVHPLEAFRAAFDGVEAALHPAGPSA
jgi:small GTP-binding protein